MEPVSLQPEELPELLEFVATNAALRPPGRTTLMTSDVAWQLPGAAMSEEIRLIRDVAGLAGYGWLQPPQTLHLDYRQGVAALESVVDCLLDWACARRALLPAASLDLLELASMDEWAQWVRGCPSKGSASGHYLLTSALESDLPRLDLLQRRGFVPTRHFEPVFLRTLDELGEGGSPGFVVRSVRPDELDARVELHRAAWAPASGFDLAQYRRVRAVRPVYDPELDLVAVSGEGRFASYTIAWQDPVSGIGSFEPFGTHPEFRGSGASAAVMTEALYRLRARGMRFARVYTAGFNHPAIRFYERSGFQRIDVNRTLVLRL